MNMDNEGRIVLPPGPPPGAVVRRLTPQEVADLCGTTVEAMRTEGEARRDAEAYKPEPDFGYGEEDEFRPTVGSEWAAREPLRVARDFRDVTVIRTFYADARCCDGTSFVIFMGHPLGYSELIGPIDVLEQWKFEHRYTQVPS